jgi:hypothetical protein
MAVCQERRRLASASPARPRPKRERLVGSGTPCDTGEREKVLNTAPTVFCPMTLDAVELFVTSTVVAAGIDLVAVGVFPLRRGNTTPFIVVSVNGIRPPKTVDAAWAIVPPTISFPALGGY